MYIFHCPYQEPESILQTKQLTQCKSDKLEFPVGFSSMVESNKNLKRNPLLGSEKDRYV